MVIYTYIENKSKRLKFAVLFIYFENVLYGSLNLQRLSVAPTGNSTVCSSFMPSVTFRVFGSGR